MAKKSVIASVAALAGATTVILGKRNLRTKLSQSIQSMYKKISRKEKRTKKEFTQHLGHSHPHDFEDHKMVGEGALTSIQYYNNKQQKSHQ
ncbi:hypothetical protein [Halalkalibacter alkalisediminis]|uniref:DUF3918 domain-containing protein n=1 Tax=Halalkalibacter alkalisediminis TaxID=935616 RepID=A0ABV6NC01_9BACI|nr:hypothetical protein [Halalkalibacter alkalisediminis]